MHVIECTTLIVDNKYYIEVETDLLLQLAYLGAYGAHMFALRVWVGFGSSEIDHKNISKKAKGLKVIQQNILNK